MNRLVWDFVANAFGRSLNSDMMSKWKVPSLLRSAPIICVVGEGRRFPRGQFLLSRQGWKCVDYKKLNCLKMFIAAKP